MVEIRQTKTGDLQDAIDTIRQALMDGNSIESYPQTDGDDSTTYYITIRVSERP